jgi:peptide-methionine (S)-S-oxide reductase
MRFALLSGVLSLLCSCSGTDAESGAPERGPAMNGSAGERTGTSTRPEDPMSKNADSNAGAPAPSEEIATFGAGCFWCVEAVLERLSGVIDVSSGYMGGAEPNPTYKQVCTGETGHAEVVQVRFDPRVLSYDALLGWFWRLHDPTTMNRQGADEGTQYRSAIFYHSEEQKQRALLSKKAADESGAFVSRIVTEITPASAFYPAEEYHQDYFRLNPRAGYCRMVIAPKLEKLGVDK